MQTTPSLKALFSRLPSVKQRSLPGLALYVVLAVMLVTMFSYHHWTRSKPNERGVIKWDVISYYAYLPATFIYGDVKLGFIDNEDFINDNKFWFFTLDNGNKLIQTSMGLSILYSPFFFTAHALAPLFGEARDGYGSIYQLFLVLSSLFYVMLGLIFLKRILLRYFTPVATTLTLLLVGLGTNLFYYTVHEGPMSHAYNFALITIFLYLLIRWYEHPTIRTTLWMGLVYGIIVLVRPSNIIAGALFLLWGLNGWPSLLLRFRFLWEKRLLLLLILLFFIIPWIPQLAYWKSVTGSFLFNSYGPTGSSFYLGAPHIIEVLFSYRKGWFVYTPVMLAAVVGLFFLTAKCRAATWGITLYLIIHVYLLASWWSWWNGGSFGHRSFVDIYGIMALPLAALLDKVLDKKLYISIIAGLVMLFLVYVNQFQTFQYTRGVIHYTGMTKEAYRLNFLRLKPDGAFWHMLSIPDSQLARLGIYYDYHTANKDAELKAMEEKEGKDAIRKEVSGDKKLSRQIRRHSERSGQTYDEALEMVVNRVYDYRISH